MPVCVLPEDVIPFSRILAARSTTDRGWDSLTDQLLDESVSWLDNGGSLGMRIHELDLQAH